MVKRVIGFILVFLGTWILMDMAFGLMKYGFAALFQVRGQPQFGHTALYNFGYYAGRVMRIVSGPAFLLIGSSLIASAGHVPARKRPSRKISLPTTLDDDD